ncbi:hypothetical protein [Methanocella arvoryzae]|uniref:hypothetical protein n=1 Tax=Methanocella arvoryzae TaxID=1175445 RepID=UPI0000DB2436|nr:hypothetical protein [Methanocella arvoryzae]
MSKFGMFQTIGAALMTIGLMFIMITGLSYTGVLGIEGIAIETAFISLLMATNGFMIMLFGVMTGGKAVKVDLGVPAAAH